MGWIAFLVLVLGISGVVGWHLGRFQDACTEMTGMMAGMTMGMLNGFVLGYAAAAATGNMFWGNVIGIGLGLTLGGYYGRGGGLMGVMDGTMGGLMGGSMGAMLAVMVAAPEWAQIATGALLGLVYLAGMVALIVLIEQRAPQYGDLHRLAPLFARFGPAPEDDAEFEASDAQPDGLVNYYELFDIPVRASIDRIVAAYTAYVAGADGEAKILAQIALGTLTNPEARARYDRELTLAAGLDECCPPPRRSSPAQTSASGTVRTGTAAAVPPRPTTVPQPAAPAVRPQARSAATRRAAPPAPLFNWRIAAVVAPILIAAGFVLLSGNPFVSTPAAGPDLSALQAQAVTAPVGPDGVQTLDLVVNGTTMSYKPSVIQVKQGVPVRFNLSVEGRDPGCGRFVGLRGLGEHGIATPGEVTAFEFTPQQTGKFEINCSMNMMRPGYLLVTQ